MDNRSVQEQLVEKYGGKFRLSSLIQKRMQELKAGATPLVKYEGNDLQALVIKEILEGKIDTAEGAQEELEL
ncbi:MAG: DNA-directed RNA polymerase subunit omega [Planctomycetota bacterium]